MFAVVVFDFLFCSSLFSVSIQFSFKTNTKKEGEGDTLTHSAERTHFVFPSYFSSLLFFPVTFALNDANTVQ